jgi:tRNA U34 5-methylaminomethyl-2-thiouridine-forming methyltransferase MnmC
VTKVPTLPPNHQWVETSDGSRTLFSEAFQEACHSTSGAREETQLHYVKGCQIEKKLEDHNRLSILEVGFGLGIGFLETYNTLQTQKSPWSFLSLELDRELLEWFRLENLEHPFLRYLKWTPCGSFSLLEASSGPVSLRILCGDARKTLPEYANLLDVKWNAIYQDAFSPKRNPVLWTQEWFKLLKQHSLPEVTLSTYSASTSIRKSLLKAGWSLHKGEKFGPKRTSTRATLQGESDAEILQHLERSPVSALTDESIKSMLKV